jgi:hypothetical protein
MNRRQSRYLAVAADERKHVISPPPSHGRNHATIVLHAEPRGRIRYYALIVGGC